MFSPFSQFGSLHLWMQLEIGHYKYVYAGINHEASAG